MAYKHLNCNPYFLTQTEVIYELKLRGRFVSTDNNKRRRDTLTSVFQKENDEGVEAPSKSPFTVEEDTNGIISTLGWLTVMSKKENNNFPQTGITESESRLAHVYARIARSELPDNEKDAYNKQADSLLSHLDRAKGITSARQEQTYFSDAHSMQDVTIQENAKTKNNDNHNHEHTDATSVDQNGVKSTKKLQDRLDDYLRDAHDLMNRSRTLVDPRRQTVQPNKERYDLISQTIQHLQGELQAEQLNNKYQLDRRRPVRNVKNDYRANAHSTRMHNNAASDDDGVYDSCGSSTEMSRVCVRNVQPKSPKTVLNQRFRNERPRSDTARNNYVANYRQNHYQRPRTNNFNDGRDNDDEAYENAPYREANNRPRREREERHRPYYADKDNTLPVFKWNFYFDGITTVSKKNCLNFEDFLDRVKEYKRCENIPTRIVLAKMPHLLQDDAYTWYQRCKNRIETWADFVYEIQNRFAIGDYEDDLHYSVYTKKQQPGESTLSYIDKMLHMMNRIDTRMAEETKLKNILRGIKPNVRLFAQTRAVESVDDLIKFIRYNFSPTDKMYEGKGDKRSFREPNKNSKPQSKSTCQLEAQTNCSDAESRSDDSDSDDYECNALNKNNKSKQKEKNEKKEKKKVILNKVKKKVRRQQLIKMKNPTKYKNSANTKIC